MPSISKELTIKLGREALWSSMVDLSKLAKCIPGYESASIVNESELTWVGRIKIGVVSRRINARVRISKQVERKELVYTIESVDGDLNGEISTVLSNGDVHDSSSPSSLTESSVTKMKLDARIEAQGSFHWLVERIIDSQMDKFASEFVSCLASGP
jgi:carbon monoxide dehydrogenase subunit G